MKVRLYDGNIQAFVVKELLNVLRTEHFEISLTLQ